mmetsp:Transcript_14767/g.17246  ORF Transcript_14767/g.17246 Transcript_14767/m.17246 type:complete len:514 (-) Transcript_14767:3261-4802(-)
MSASDKRTMRLRRSSTSSSKKSIYGYMPSKHPLLGSFHHAPSAKNAGSKYFASDIISIEDYERRKDLRNNPFTGNFHSGPASYSDLHNLRKFRSVLQVSMDMNKEDEQERETEDLKKTLSCSALEKGNVETHFSNNVDISSASFASYPEIKTDSGIGSDSDSTSDDVFTFEEFSNTKKMTIGVPANGRMKSSMLDERILQGSSNALNWGDLNLGGRYKSVDYKIGRRVSMHEQKTLTKHDKVGTLKKIRTRSDAPVEYSFQTAKNVRARSFSLPVTPSRVQSISRNESGNSLIQPESDSEDILFEYKPMLTKADQSRWVVKTSTKVTEKYELCDNVGELGTGTYSIVKSVRHRDSGNVFALKIINKRYLYDKEEKEMIKREVQIHQVLSHENIIPLYDIFETTNKLYLVMEKANRGTLEDIINLYQGSLPEHEISSVFVQLVDAVIYLHDNGVLQGDIKPSNVLLSYSTDSVNCEEQQPEPSSAISKLKVKLCDFGLSRKVPDVKYYKYTGGT